MSTTAAAGADPTSISDQNKTRSQPDVESNHELPARTMAEDQRHDHTNIQKEDPATVAASEELKHTSISDKATSNAQSDPTGVLAEVENEDDKRMEEMEKATTPEPEPTDAQDEEMRERLSSPKKKRGRDQDDDIKELEDDRGDEPGSSADGSVVNGGRTTRLGPEKKRPRDGSEDRLGVPDDVADVTATASGDIKKTSSGDSEASKKDSESANKPTFGSALNEKPQTSASAFASSGFASLAASSTSPFGSIGATKPSVFGGNVQPATSGFGALAGATSTTITSGFGNISGDRPATGFDFGSGASSGFGGLASGSGFGSALKNGFAGGAGQKLSSFAAPGTASTVIGSKPAKAFGAPDSDAEEGSDDDDSEGAAGSDDEESASMPPEDKKKVKLAKVHVEDGESGEATLLQLRAKLFALDSKEAGWKERGVGTLKVNVPKSCAGFDENGIPIPGSFDASGLEEEDDDPNAPRVARLIMRQENTHRVILNTIIVRAMKFEDKPSTSTAQIMFTAFEGGEEPKPINMLLKMSEANARLFHSEVESIQHEL